MIELQRRKEWSDLDSGLRIDATGNVIVKEGTQALSQSIINILSTAKFSRPRSTVGSGIGALLFEPVSEQTAQDMEQLIVNAIERNDNRIARVQANVIAFPEDNYYQVEIRFKEKGSLTYQEITSFLSGFE